MNIEIVTLLIFLLSFGLKKHTLTLLLSLELFGFLIIMFLVWTGVNLFFALLLVCVSACEGAVGLSSLISMVRVNKNVNV